MPNQEESAAITNAVLDVKLTNLIETTKTGFEGVHKRQDETNGKVLRNSERILKLESREWFERVMWFLVTTLVGLTVFLLK